MPRLANPYVPSALTFEQEPFCKAPLATYAPTAPLALHPANIYEPRHGAHAPAPAQALQKEIKLSAQPLGKPFDEMSDSDASTSSSPLHGRRRCLCGKEVVQDGGIYCSSACARTDAFSSLCYKPMSVAAPQPHPSLGTSLDRSSFMRHHASTSTATSQSTYSERDTMCSTASSSSSDWSASHYRRLARQDLRREERREERRRRRAEGSVASTNTASSSLRATHMSSSSTSSSRVPDLIGGQLGLGHSRTHSTASTASSAWSGSQLSRNPSMASVSSLSSRRGPGSSATGGGFAVDGTIMEAEDEEEMLAPAHSGGGGESRTYPVPRKAGAHKRRLSHSLRGIGSDEKSPLGAAGSEIGVGRDMRDVLEEILQMEKMFMVDEEEPLVVDMPQRLDPTDLPAYRPPLTGPPPKTPPPRAADKDRMSGIVQAPMAPSRGHKHSLSNANVSPVMCGGRGIGARPPSFIGGHQSSLSESHTALYLATASPTQDSPLRRSASPTLEARRSLHFDANSAGPSIAALQAAAAAVPGGSGGPAAVARFESPISANVTPRRRKINFSPAHHPTIDHWRFPSATASTPTRPHHLPPINTNLAPVIAAPVQLAPASLSVPAAAATSLRSIAPAARPTRQNSGSSTISSGGSTRGPSPAPGSGPMQTTPTPATSSTASSADARIPQHLLWPPPPNLAPSLFPTSPNDTPDYRPAARGAHGGARLSPTSAASPQVFVPPNSGLRLGVLLGSGEDDGMGMDLDDDAGSAHSHGSSTVHGHGQSGFARLGQSTTTQNAMAGRGGFPVFLEAEGFRPSVRQRW